MIILKSFQPMGENDIEKLVIPKLCHRDLVSHAVRMNDSKP
jgi:hypothetical protein